MQTRAEELARDYSTTLAVGRVLECDEMDYCLEHAVPYYNIWNIQETEDVSFEEFLEIIR